MVLLLVGSFAVCLGLNWAPLGNAIQFFPIPKMGQLAKLPVSPANYFEDLVISYWSADQVAENGSPKADVLNERTRDWSAFVLRRVSLYAVPRLRNSLFFNSLGAVDR
jgi:hypothetical protein